MGAFWGSLKFVSFHWQHVIIPRPGAECNNCKRRSRQIQPGFPDRDVRPITTHSGSPPDSPLWARRATPGNYGVAVCRTGKGSLSAARDASMRWPIRLSECLISLLPYPHCSRIASPQYYRYISSYHHSEHSIHAHDPLRGIISTPQPFLSISPRTPRVMQFTPDSSSRDHGSPCSLAFVLTSTSGMCCMRQFFAGSGCVFFSLHMTVIASNPWLHHGTLLHRHPNPNRPPPRLCLIECDHKLETLMNLKFISAPKI